MKTVIKIDRFMAWVLLFSMTLFFITGYGMTKGIIDSTLAVNLHNKYLPIVVIIAFVFHAGCATRLAFIRWKWWNWFIKAIWFLFFASFLVGFFYINYFYEKPVSSVDATKNVATDTEKNEEEEVVAEESSTKIFTAEDLATHDGQNGSPAYVAVSGKVYDLSSVFQEGKHYSHYAGKELTNAFLSYHASSVLSKYPVIGEFK